MAYGIRRFNAAITRTLQKTLSWAVSTQFLVLIPISLTSFLILSFLLLIGLHKGLSSVGVPVKMLKAFLPYSILATWPAHFNLLDLFTLATLGERCKLMTGIYLLYGTTDLEELWPPSNESLFILFNFSYTYFLLEAEWWVIIHNDRYTIQK